MKQQEEVIIGAQRYAIKRMKADIGAWLLQRCMASFHAMAKQNDLSNVDENPEAPRPTPEQSLNGLVAILLRTASRAEFSEYQKLALDYCSQYKAIGEKEVLVPVMMVNGNFASKELEYDIAGVTQLTQKAMVFTLLPFFQDSELTQ